MSDTDPKYKVIVPCAILLSAGAFLLKFRLFGFDPSNGLLIKVVGLAAVMWILVLGKRLGFLKGNR
jgi:hypothetical protein